eukprot:TCONS_00055885-protein
MLRFSNNGGIKEDPPLVKTGRKWKVEEATCQEISYLNHTDIVGAVQEAKDERGSRPAKFPTISRGRSQKQHEATSSGCRNKETRTGKVISCLQIGRTSKK